MASYDPHNIPIDFSALKHGVAEVDIRHALAHHLMNIPTNDDGFTMTIGPARSGVLLEVGVISDDDGVGVVHAMVARTQFLEGWLIP